MERHRIDYTRTPKSEGQLELWAHFEGTRKDAQRSARGLLSSLREELGLTRARVFLDGSGVRMHRMTTGVPERKVK